MQQYRWIVITIIALSSVACVTTRGDSSSDKRAAILQMRDTTLADLYRIKQGARAEIAASPGYGVFSNANVNVILASFAGGYGVVHNNQTGQDIYMKMGEIGLGLGAGVKDYRVVFVFHDAKTLDDFVTRGWAFGGQADAAAKAGDKGAAIGGEAILDGVSVYQLTESGLALQATVKGTKYWRDKDLN